MSNPTPEEIVNSLNSGEGFTLPYSETIWPKDENGKSVYDHSRRSEIKEVDHGQWPMLRTELPDEAPEYVKEDSLDLEEYSNPIEYIISEVLYDPKDVEILGLPVEEIEDVGGEGEGDEAYKVVKVGDYFFRADYSYASWDGFYYDSAEFRQVHPKEVVVTVYE